MPGRLEFEVLSRSQGALQGRARAPGQTRRLLLMGNFSGHNGAAGSAGGDGGVFAQRRTWRVDLDTFDDVLARLAPGLTLKLGEEVHALSFRSLDDFHAETLLQASAPLRRLNELRLQLLQPASFAQAAARLLDAAPSGAGAGQGPLAALLGGRVAALTPTPSAAAAGVDAFIRQVVAPYVQPAAPPLQAQYVAAAQAVLVQALRSLLHHADFQALEGAWRGVSWLLSTLELDEGLELHLLDASREDLLADVIAAHGQPAAMQLTRVLSGGEGEPQQRWTALLGLFAFDSSVTDIGLLAALGRVAQSTGAPFLAGASPGLLGTASLDAVDLASSPDSWQALRRSEVAPWIGLAAPRLLMRVPYGRGGEALTAFSFEETDSASAHEDYLWAPAALACAWALAQPGAGLTLDGLPGWAVQREGESVQLPCAEHWLGESAWHTLLQAGLIPLVSHAGRHAVQLPRLQSIAQPLQPLAGL